jgi:hypothetical protein
VLEWIEGWSGSAARGTSCLLGRLAFWCCVSVVCVMLTLENIQADATKLINIRVEDLCQEPDLWRSHGVVIGQEEL